MCTPGFVSLETLIEVLGTTLQQTQVLLDLFASVVDDSTALQTSPDGSPVAVDAHRLVLFLFVQYYTREASRADTADVWPSDHPSATQLEPSSPMRLAARPWVKDQPHHRAHLPATRQKMQEQLLYEESVINGFGAFVSRHAAELVALAAVGGAAENAAATAAFGAGAGGGGAGTGVLSDTEDIFDASASEMDEQPIEEGLTAFEIDRLGFLIQTGVGLTTHRGSGGGSESMQEDAMMVAAGGATASGNITSASPMELCNEPSIGPTITAVLTGEGSLCKPLSRCLPASVLATVGGGGGGGSSSSGVSVASMVDWVRTSLGSTDLNNRNKNGGAGGSLLLGGASGGGGGGSGGGDVPMFGASPPQARFSMFDQLVPPTLSLLQPVDVHGVHRATVLRGESDFLSTNSIDGENIDKDATPKTFRVLDCHDAVVYCLAPIDYATISCCTDCIVILGAAGKAVRVERCERVQVVIAAQHVVINTCHDCIFYLAVNRPPVLLGDNRFVQLAPHNAGYDQLEDHVTRSGIKPEPNAWCNVTPLLPDQHQHAAATKHHNAFLAGGGSYGSSPPLNSSGGGGLTFNPFNQSPSVSGGSGGSGGNEASAGAGASSPISLSLSPLKMPSPRSPSLAPLATSPGGTATALGVAAGGAAGGAGALSPEQQQSLNNNTSTANHHGAVAHPPSATLLPPAKLLPFLVPFTGGKGPLCGGPVRPRSSSNTFDSGAAAAAAAEEDLLGGLLGGAGTLGAEAFGPTPFPLPAEYAASWEERMNGMTAVRSAYRHAGLDDVRKREFIGAIQANFKEWLQAGSGMRMKEVYDLARAEKEENAHT